jgi:hypothetical protein
VVRDIVMATRGGGSGSAGNNKNIGKPKPPNRINGETNNNNGNTTTTKSVAMLRKYATLLLCLGVFFTAISPYARPTRESFYAKCVREKLGSSSSSSSSSLVDSVSRWIQPEGELCSKNMLYDDYFLFSTMAVNDRVYLGVLSWIWVPIPWPVSVVVAKTVLQFARANRKVLRIYAGAAVGFVLMKILKKIMMVVKLAFALIALKLLTGESFAWVLITLLSHGAFAYLVLFQKFPGLKKMLVKGKRR